MLTGFKKSLVVAALAGGILVPMITPALAWRPRVFVGIGIPAPVFVAPSIVIPAPVMAPPVVVVQPAYVPPPPHWVRGHYNWRGFWVPGHWV